MKKRQLLLTSLVVVAFAILTVWVVLRRRWAENNVPALTGSAAASGMFESDEAMMQRLNFPPEAYVPITELPPDPTPVQPRYQAEEGDVIENQSFMIEPETANYPRQSSWMDMGLFESKVKSLNENTGAVTFVVRQVHPGQVGVEGGSPMAFGISPREYTRLPDGSLVAAGSATIEGEGYSAEVEAMKHPPGQLIFPEGEIVPGDKWSPAGAAGVDEAGQKTEYHFRGYASVGDTRCMVIEERSIVKKTIQIRDENGRLHPVNITATVEGTHYFDLVEGRLHRRDLLQKTAVETDLPKLPDNLKRMKSEQRLISFVNE